MSTVKSPKKIAQSGPAMGGRLPSTLVLIITVCTTLYAVFLIAPHLSPAGARHASSAAVAPHHHASAHDMAALMARLAALEREVRVLRAQSLGQHEGHHAAEHPGAEHSGGAGGAPEDLPEDLDTKVAVLDQVVVGVMAENDRFRKKVDAFMSWGTDPFKMLSEKRSMCNRLSDLAEIGCKSKDRCPGLYDHQICLDHLPAEGRKCVVYDFGIREQPEFGDVLSGEPFHCDVFAFDPSPVSTKFMAHHPYLQDRPNYHFQPVGGGGVDGTVKLNEYNWGQVSIVNFPATLHEKPEADGHYRVKGPARSRSFHLPVKRIDTVIKELGHDRIDVLKVDIEGSEYAFLEVLVDSGECWKVDQVTVEWHHFDFDPRYGGGASPHINALVAMMQDCGLEPLWSYGANGGWPSGDPLDAKSGMTLRFNLQSFIRTRERS